MAASVQLEPCQRPVKNTSPCRSDRERVRRRVATQLHAFNARMKHEKENVRRGVVVQSKFAEQRLGLRAVDP